MKHWENTIRQAQLAFQAKVYSAAIVLNKEALDIASNTFEENVKHDVYKAVASVMVSHFSLADSYIAIKAYDQAHDVYQECSYFIRTINVSSLHKNIDFKAAVHHAMNKLKHEWSIFKKYHGHDVPESQLIAPHEFQQNLSYLLKPNLSVH